MPVATVATLDELRVSVEVPERYVPALEPRMEGKITSFAAKGSDFDAVVEKIEPTIDSSTRSKLVKLGIEESSGELSAGMFVRVELPLERALDAVSVPFEAVVQEGGEEYVYTVENGVARRVSVRTGIIAGDRVEITGGLEKGVRVIVEGHQELRPGKPVREVESEGTAE
jgi:membrane fusion protein (multidrug efflux system)